eukprot:4004882-Pyramimonas_sp.AAC.1
MRSRRCPASAPQQVPRRPRAPWGCWAWPVIPARGRGSRACSSSAARRTCSPSLTSGSRRASSATPVGDRSDLQT